MKKILLVISILSTVFLNITQAQCLTGTYTIGGATPSYTTISGAVTALTSNGICGPVIFQIRSGIYLEQITLPNIIGSSATNTITFESENKDSSSVELSFPSSSNSTNNFVIKINGIDNLIISKITIHRTGALLFSNVILISNKSDNFLLSHNEIKSGNISGGDKLSGLIYNSSGGSSNMRLFANRFEQGSYGIFSEDVYPTYNVFVCDSNIFSAQYKTSINLSKTNDILLRFNVENNITLNGGGISINGSTDSLQINANVVCGKIALSNCNLTGDSPSVISNNFVGKKGGITLSGVVNLRIYYNTVFSASPYSQSGTNNVIKIVNNIFDFTGGVPPVIPNSGGTTSSNNTILNNHSIFYSASDFHILYDDFIYYKALWKPEVTTDIDGDVRNTMGPCVGADEFQLPVSDARISSIDNILAPHCGGVIPVLVTVYNGGAIPLQIVTINWSVDGVVQPPYNWSGFLFSPNVTAAHVNIGSFLFTSNNAFNIKVWTSNPDTGPDQFVSNDTAYYLYTADGISGNYTIGGVSPDYTTLNGAYVDLYNRGICGSVVFNIRPGGYTFGAELNHINGASSVNTITFQSENSDSLSVVINAFGNSTDSWAILINSGDSYIFNQITLYVPVGNFHSSCVEIKGISSNNKFYNCLMKRGFSSSLWTGDATIRLSGSNTKTKFVRNRIGYTDAGWSFYSHADRELLLKENHFEGAIRTINYRVRDTIVGNYCPGMIIKSDSAEVKNNHCHGSFGIDGKYNYAYNNFIYGQVFVRGVTTTFIHNTVKGQSNSDYEGLITIDDSATVKNNIFYNESTTRSIYNIQSNTITLDGYANSNWNDLYSPHGKYAFAVGIGSMTTFAAWKTATGFDLSSISQDPPFVSAADIHLFSPGITIPLLPSFSFCTDDIDGDLRISTSPKVGADEFASATGTFDGSVSSLEIGTNICYGNQPIKVKIYNNENSPTLTYAVIKWQVNGINQPVFLWNGSVSSFDTSSVFTIGNYFFNGGNNTIKVWITSSNGFNDPNPTNDTLTRTSFINHPVQIGNDTTICEGNSLNLNANNFTSFLWSNGSTAQTINANAAGNYFVAVTDYNGCSSSDSLHITIPISNLGNDTSICSSSELILEGGSDFVSYVWSTGATTENITALPGNIYSVTGYGINSCISRDTIMIGSNPLPIIHLSNDTTICANSTITLSPGIYSSYHWSSGSTASTYSDYGGRFGIPNTIWVTVKNNFGCANSDTINVYAKQVNATVTCSPSGAILDAGPDYYLYNWIGDNVGLISTSQIATVTTPDLYTINAVDLGGCEAISEYNVNTFSPISNFTFSNLGMTYSFSCPSNNLLYLWDFGDGSFASVQNPSHTYLSSGIYLVKLTVSNACGSNLSNQTVSLSNVGIANKIGNGPIQITIFPNPFSLITTLAFNNEQRGCIVKITDVLGKEIKTINFTGKELIVEKGEMKEGIYFVQIIDENKNIVNKKIVIQ